MSQAPELLSLATVNAMDRAAFVSSFGDIFEHSPWVAEAAWNARPFATLDDLHRAMVNVVEASGDDRKIELFRAHPELAGKEAAAGTMTNSSVAEQSSVGLNALTAEEASRLSRLNTDYRAKFGFPFIIAVRRHSKDGIFAELERRLGNAPEDEIQNNLMQVAAITRLRLDGRVTDGGREASPRAIPAEGG